MTKFIFFIIVIFGLAQFSHADVINECKTDIYYGNGVWNEPEDAEKSRLQLEIRILNREIIKNNPALKAKYGNVKLAYNTSFGKLGDVLEVYYQLKQAGQLDGVGFYTAIAAITVYQPHITLGAIATQKLSESLIQEEEEANVGVMWEKYYHESFKLGHRVLLVSHSQGNLFANRLHDKINPTEYRRYFSNVQVASPASEVKAEKGSYVTLFGDLIINPIPNSMTPNAQGSIGQLKSFGHAFISAYLNQADPYKKIVSRIKGFLPTLDTELSQWDTDGEPTNKDTCEEKIKVKHSFDLAVDMPYEVYPFNASKKLYQVNGEYVKASCGGKNILGVGHDIITWDGKKDNECLMIDNVEEEKIEAKQRFIRDDEKEVVLDTNTSLVWQDNVDVSTIQKPCLTIENYGAQDYFNTSGDTAATYCENLTLGGYGDWRLPTADELRSVGHPYTISNHKLIQESFVYYFTSRGYWSSSIYANTSYYAWIIFFHFDHQGYNYRHYYYDVRCVRAGQ